MGSVTLVTLGMARNREAEWCYYHMGSLTLSFPFLVFILGQNSEERLNLDDKACNISLHFHDR